MNIVESGSGISLVVEYRYWSNIADQHCNNVLHHNPHFSLIGLQSGRILRSAVDCHRLAG